MEPTSLSSDLYKATILEDNYVSSVDHPNKFLDFDYATRVATPAQITSALEAWKKQSDKLKVVEYARTHENRPLHAVFISSPKNLKNLPLIKQKINQLSDARVLNDRKAKALIDELPAIAWMAYSIHGNETSGADAASESEDLICFTPVVLSARSRLSRASTLKRLTPLSVFSVCVTMLSPSKSSLRISATATFSASVLSIVFISFTLTRLPSLFRV